MLGPVLYFRGLEPAGCRLAALLVLPATDTPPSLTPAGSPAVTATALATRQEQTVWRYDFSLPVGQTDGVDYALGEQSYRVHPPTGSALRLAFTACNGQEEDVVGHVYPERNERWRELWRQHQELPFQLLLQGGDQLYADRVWQAVPELADWISKGRPTDWQPPEGMVEAVHDFYFSMYLWLWSQPELAPILASIPSLMMWDDHDICDGWGSHSPERQACPAFQAVWQGARTQFALFQLAARPDELPTGIGDSSGQHFGWSYRLGDVGILCPDLRSERTDGQVMGEAGWRWFDQALARFGDCRQVLLLSTVPVLNVDLSWLERLLLLLPREQMFQDDLRDQWRSFAHRREWWRLINRLLDFSVQTRTQFTVLSGEIHLAAFGRLVRGETVLHQLTSSGIVHPPPPNAYASTLNWLGRGSKRLNATTTLTMLRLPGWQKRYLTARNFLTLDSAADGSLEARWYAEGIEVEMAVTLPGPAVN